MNQKFFEPERLGQWFSALFKSKQQWDLNELTWALQRQDGIYKYSYQNKNELAQLLIFLYSKREKIRHYIEVGVCRCGTFYTIDQFLKTFAPNYQSSIAIDSWHSPFVEYGLLEYFEKCPWAKGLRKQIQRVSLKELPTGEGIVAFIDCEHTYECTKSAWEKLSARSEIVIFDDICHEKYEGPRQLWKELENKYKSFVIQTNDPVLSKGNGYGVLFGGLP